MSALVDRRNIKRFFHRTLAAHQSLAPQYVAVATLTKGAKLSPDLRLRAVRREGNAFVAEFRNEYTLKTETREVDQVVAEHGTLPRDDLYFALKPLSRNRGEVDYHALVGGRAQAIVANPAGGFLLYRVGDAVASHNIHAAIFDSPRLCNDL
jgi:hypothetical protein